MAPIGATTTKTHPGLRECGQAVCRLPYSDRVNILVHSRSVLVCYDGGMIEIQHLQFAYTDGAFSLQIAELKLEGQSAVIVGPSGSGKTTLLNLMAGILPVQHGEILVADTALHQLSDADRRLFRLRNVGLVFQDFQLIEYLSVIENVLLPCRIHPEVRLTQELRSRAASLLGSTGLAEMKRRSITRLSQGERQRVAICRALLLSPKIVLADEPTGNLDPINSERIVRLLLNETARAGAMLVMVTHDHSLLPHFERVVPFEPFLKIRESSAMASSESDATGVRT
jgi:putative ABC transport system ATP-binding protein